jgi:hypothetical protein
VVERKLAWLNRFRRLTVRYDRRADLDVAISFARLCAYLVAGSSTVFCRTQVLTKAHFWDIN